MIRLIVALLVVLNTIPAAGAVETIIRGPYLQQATPSSIVVRWRTDVAVTGRVRYGTTLGSPTLTASGTSATTEHSVKLTGLTAGVRYYYDVGNTSAVVVSGETYSFTATPTSTTASVRVWVLGDCGTRTASQSAVRDAFYAWNGSKRADVTLLLGDNAYNNGTDSEYQGAIFDMYKESLRQGVFWSTVGNHDTAGSTNPALTIPYFQIFTNPTAGEAGGVASGTEKYYAFDHGPIHFVCLDSMTSSRSATGAMATWLKNDLAATTKPWLVAFWHHPPYTKGSHDSDSESQLAQMREVFVPILEDHGVDLVLSGHSHSYERSYLLDGHHGASSTLTAAMKKNAGDGRVGGGGAYVKTDVAHQGAVYAVPGSAGKISGGSLDHPAMVVSLNELASLVFDVSGDRLDATMIRSDGVIRDTFTIIHQASNLPVVTLTATDAAAGEPANHAAFSVTRSGATTGNLTVNLQWSGSAVRGSDFTAATSVVIPAGSASAAVTLTVTDDQLLEGDETATITLASSGSYLIGGAASSTVTISDNDSTTITVSVAASADDAEQDLATGAIDLTSTDLELIRDGSSDQLVGMRFANLTVPRNATVASATIQFTVDEATSAATSLIFQAEATDNAAGFTTVSNNLSGRSRSAASVAWNPGAWSTIGSRGSEARSPELKTLVQGVVARTGWVSGNALAVLVSGSGSRVANSRDRSGGTPAALRVVWSAVPPSVSSTTATPSPVTAKTSTVKAIASDDGGEAALTYMWSTVAVPSGGAVTFSPNGSNSAKTSTATFTRAGAYTLRVTATDAGGLSTTRDLSVNVTQTLTTITVAPISTSVATAGMVTFTATGRDQFAQPLSPQPTWTWSVNGGGTISGAGVFTAGASAGGPWTVTAASASITGTATVTVTASQQPIRINFQPATAPTYAGYLVDSGSVFGARGNGLTYGWLGTANDHTRDRNATNAGDQRYDTLNHLQKAGNATWEVQVPNGAYEVLLVCGDPSFFDSVFKLSVEGVLLVNGTPTSANRWITGSGVVQVGDGRLTLTPAAGASNAKVSFIEIVPQPVASN